MALSLGNCIGAIFSFIGMILGYSGFVTFIFVYHNYNAGVLSFLSGLYATVVFLLNVLDIKNRIKDWYTKEDFKCMRLFALVGMLIGSSTMVWYIFMHIYMNVPILPVDTSMIIPSVWAFMTVKWSAVLFLSTRKYTNIIEEEQALLPGGSSGNY